MNNQPTKNKTCTNLATRTQKLEIKVENREKQTQTPTGGILTEKSIKWLNPGPRRYYINISGTDTGRDLQI